MRLPCPTFFGRLLDLLEIVCLRLFIGNLLDEDDKRFWAALFRGVEDACYNFDS